MARKELLTRILRGSSAGRFPNQPGHQLHPMKVNMGILQNYSNRLGYVFIRKEDNFSRYGSILPPREEDSFSRYESILYPKEDMESWQGGCYWCKFSKGIWVVDLVAIFARESMPLCPCAEF